MDSEKRTGIQITQQPANREISIVNGGLKIMASEKPLNSSLAVDWGRVYFLLDCSGSMKGPKLDLARVGIVDFARDAFNKQYLVGLIKFSDRADLISEPVQEIEKLQDGLRGIRAGGSTNLTAAVNLALAKLKDISGARVIVVATDGMPDSAKGSLAAADIVKAAGIEIITIGTDDANLEFLKKLASRTELSSRVASDMFGKAISSASLLLMSPRSIQPR
jgi:Mg-chelatase subunit ChlD